MVLALTGMRINEVLGLRVEDVDFENKLIHIRKSAYNGTLGTPKSDASAADIPLPELACPRKRTRSSIWNRVHIMHNRAPLRFPINSSRAIRMNNLAANLILVIYLLLFPSKS